MQHRPACGDLLLFSFNELRTIIGFPFFFSSLNSEILWPYQLRWSAPVIWMPESANVILKPLRCFTLKRMRVRVHPGVVSDAKTLWSHQSLFCGRTCRSIHADVFTRQVRLAGKLLSTWIMPIILLLTPWLWDSKDFPDRTVKIYATIVQCV